jgi:hypothetical protein
MRASSRRSSHWFAALALAATSSVPSIACSTTSGSGVPHVATIAAAATTASSITAIRGLVSST